MPRLHRSGAVLLLDLGSDENRLTLAWMSEVEACLDEIEADEGPCALVTCADGKYWSNGLDLDWMAEHPDESVAYMGRVNAMVARFLVAPLPTVAAVQGHAFGLGAFISIAHDFRVMRADRGYWCLPEVTLGLPFPGGMLALAQAKLPPATVHEAMTTGRRYGGADAEAAGIVNAAVPLEEVVDRAVSIAEPLAGNAGGVLAGIKRDIDAHAHQRLTAAAEKADRLAG